MSSTAAKRPGTAYAAAIAARQRRQLIFAISLVVLLIGVLAWEIPKLHLFGGHKSASVAPPVFTTPTVTPTDKNILGRLRKRPASDPFSEPVSGSSGYAPRGSVPVPPGSVDPFANEAPAGSTAATSPLPQQIVIGTPGGGRAQTHGWIVIMASIPTGEGRAAAANFSDRVRREGVTDVAILNSSNRRPLRGGYWVVYLGPYATVGEVSSRAAGIHAAGFPTAYIRELIVYK